VVKKQKLKPFIRAVRYIGCISFSLLVLWHLSFAYGSVTSDSGVQFVPALIAAFTFGFAAVRVTHGLPITSIIFWGTLPFWLVHIPMTILLDDESPIFVILSSVAPATAGIIWLINWRPHQSKNA
jgi:hypothetical protein